MNEINLNKISTENRNPNTLDIDSLTTIEILKKINNEDKLVAYAVEKALPFITIVIDKVVDSFKNGGRLIYMGAGTSGRIGILDAVECPPTYGVDYDLVQCLMAGGTDAFVKAKEGAEDSITLPIEDLNRIQLNSNDFVIGIAASGRTPYVIAGVEYAKTLGAKTACITTSENSLLEKAVDYPIVCITGPEVITGSTRMKSGTCQKMICNMITTASMIKLGKVYQNLMIDVKATNEKLIARSYRILESAIGCSKTEAVDLLNKYKTIKRAIFASITGITTEDEINKILTKYEGNIQQAIKGTLNHD